MNKQLTGLALAAGLGTASLGANGAVISCNMESINTPTYDVCMDLDKDNNTLSLDILVPTNSNYFTVKGLTLTDLDNFGAFMGGTKINSTLSSSNDILGDYGAFYAGVNNSFSDDYLNLTLDINNTDLMNSLLAGTTGIDYSVILGHKFGSNETISGEAFYTPESVNVPEPSTIGILGLGLLGISGFAANRRNKKQNLESSLK
jgi:hypothetical protein